MNLLLYKFILYGRLYGRTVFLIVPLAFVKCGRAVFFGCVHISMNFRFLNKTKKMPNRSLFFALQPSCGLKQAENKSVFYNEVNGVCVTMRQKGNQSGIHKCVCLTWEQDRNRKIPQIFHEQWLNSRRRNSKKKIRRKKTSKETDTNHNQIQKIYLNNRVIDIRLLFVHRMPAANDLQSVSI